MTHKVRIYSALGACLALCGLAFGQSLGIEPAEQQYEEQQSVQPEPAVTEPELAEQQTDTYSTHAEEPAHVAEPEQIVPELTESPPLESVPAPPPPAEETPLRGTARHYVSASPGFIIVNTAVGGILGSNWVKNLINDNRNMEINGVKDDVLSVFLLKARGEASVTNIKSSGFGFALQYERPLLERFSLMGRFSYAGLGMSMDFVDRYIDQNHSTGERLQRADKFFIDVNYYNWNIETHSRYYLREGESFFLDGVLGFGGAGLAVKKSQVEGQGDYIVRTPDGFEVRNSEKTVKLIDAPARRSYISIGPMCGWRRIFGNNLVWETSVGYLFGIGFGKSLTDRVIEGNIALPHVLGEDSQDVEDGVRDYMGLAEMLMVKGGPRFRMTLGWAF